MAAKKQSKKRVPVLAFAYEEDLARGDRGDTICVDDMQYTLEYRSPLPKGCFYADKLDATSRCLSKAKRVHFEKPPPSPADKARPFKPFKEQRKQRDEAEQKAALMLRRLNKDPKSKARTSSSRLCRVRD